VSASRTILNKQGRKQGLLASARRVAPAPRAQRMASPWGNVTVDRYTRATNVLVAKRLAEDAAAEQRA
jgi:hypothetical protein